MKRAFTLIELLIVVAIIAILAAIAVPNFLEAQTRARISRVKNDLRTLAMALESYRSDNTGYPVPFVASSQSEAMFELTTPIAYLTSHPKDVFNRANGFGNPNGQIVPFGPLYSNYKYTYYKTVDVQTPYGRARSWPVQAQITSIYTPQDAFLVFSWGPDALQNNMDGWVSGIWDASFDPYAIYDPTNGTVSWGDIGRVGGSPISKYGKLLISGQK